MIFGYALQNLLETWVGRLSVILFGYGTIFIPGYLIIHYLRKTQYIDRAGSGTFSKLIVSCIYGSSYDRIVPDDIQSQRSDRTEQSQLQNAIKLIICFSGLQLSYLTWGVLQEKIMTKEYQTAGGAVGYFRDSQFLVFINRILAFAISGLYILLVNQPRNTIPLYKYSFCSFSNIMSSWCQYEALKFISFPTQVLAKASKIIPTMIMGKIVTGKKYEYFDYLTALLISCGMALFLLGSNKEHLGSSSTTTSGVLLLVGYMTFDSFTSNWQGALFTQYKMSSVQMMCGVNFFSCLLTAVSLLQQSSFTASIEFMFSFPTFVSDCIVLSICSATGQLFIFYTISSFGPVVFVIIMTIRQGLAILLSCIIYSHPVSGFGVVGILILFFGIFLRIYCNYRMKHLRQPVAETTKV